jgi:hypothetical protein
MQISIDTNFPQVAKALRQFGTDIADKATVRALNRTIEQARTRMSREIRAEYAIDARSVRERLKIKRAFIYGSRRSIEAALYVTPGRGRSLNVIRFTARQTAQGVSVRIRKAGGRKLLRGAFIANAGRTVFFRLPGTEMTTKPRKWGGQHDDQLKPVSTIDVGQMFNAKRINAAVVAAIEDIFPRVFERELAFYAKKAGVFTP